MQLTFRPPGLILVASALLNSLSGSVRQSHPGAPPPCHGFEPETTEVRGRLLRLTFPGPPDYESVAHGDSAETGLYLRLEEAACFSPAPDAQHGEAVPSDTLIQLILDPQEDAFLRPLLGKILIVRGRASSAVTGHHHTPVLLQVDSAGPALEN